MCFSGIISMTQVFARLVYTMRFPETRIFYFTEEYNFDCLILRYSLCVKGKCFYFSNVNYVFNRKK